MAEHLGFQVDPGIELRAALRGPRLSLGPRIDRIDPAPPEPAVADRHRAWAELAGGGLIPIPEPKGRRARRRRRQEWQTIHDHLEAVTTLHERALEHAQEPSLEAREVDHDEIRQDLMAEATHGLSPLAVLARGRVRRATRHHLDDAVADRAELIREEDAQDHDELRGWWSALLRNDPDVVRDRLHHAFELHRFAAAVAAVHGNRADLVVPVAKPAALVGDREPTTEPGGKRTLPRMTKERRHEWFEAAIGSGFVSTAAEAFAVAPGLDRVAAAIVEPEHVGGPAVLALVEVTRDLVLPDRATQPAIGRIREVEQVEDEGLGRVVIDRGDVSGALRRLDESHPDVAPVLEVLTTELTS